MNNTRTKRSVPPLTTETLREVNRQIIRAGQYDRIAEAGVVIGMTPEHIENLIALLKTKTDIEVTKATVAMRRLSQLDDLQTTILGHGTSFWRTQALASLCRSMESYRREILPYWPDEDDDYDTTDAF